MRSGVDVVRAREDRVPVELLDDLAAERIDLLDRFDLVAEELDADRVLLVDREDLDHVAAHAERAAVEVDVVALVLHVDQAPQELVAPELLPLHELTMEPG